MMMTIKNRKHLWFIRWIKLHNPVLQSRKGEKDKHFVSFNDIKLTEHKYSKNATQHLTSFTIVLRTKLNNNSNNWEYGKLNLVDVFILYVETFVLFSFS